MRLEIVGLAAVAALGVAGTAMADGRVTMTDATGGYNGPNPGGAFTATKAAAAGWQDDYNGHWGDNRRGSDGRATESFLTFCLERTEYIGFGGTYYTSIATGAVMGGASGGNPDPISNITAFIYREFRSIPNVSTSNVPTIGKFGNILGLGTGADAATRNLRPIDTEAIQMAIWFEEGEMNWADMTALAQGVWTWANQNNDGSLGGVRVLNLWTSHNQNGYYNPNQSMLTIIPLPPAAWAGLSTLAGVGFVGYIRRRKNTAQ